jgi:hypothetical protein
MGIAITVFGFSSAVVASAPDANSLPNSVLKTPISGTQNERTIIGAGGHGRTIRGPEGRGALTTANTEKDAKESTPSGASEQESATRGGEKKDRPKRERKDPAEKNE